MASAVASDGSHWSVVWLPSCLRPVAWGFSRVGEKKVRDRTLITLERGGGYKMGKSRV